MDDCDEFGGHTDDPKYFIGLFFSQQERAGVRQSETGQIWTLFLLGSSGDRLRQTENRATRCKVERLQLLMQQKRLRRKARRDSRAPYHWLPNRKAGRSNSNSSMSSEGSLDLDFEDSVWKPDVKADMKSEFIMAWSSEDFSSFTEARDTTGFTF